MGDFRLPALNMGERLYRALLHLYPSRFRRDFERDLIEAFRDQRRDAAQRRWSLAAFYLSVVHDLLTQAIAERASSIWSILRKPSGRDREESLMFDVHRILPFSELRHATRRLLRVPSFSITTVLVLALGIGATTAVFSVVNGVLLRPLPYADPQRLVALTHSIQLSGTRDLDQSDASVLFYQEHARALSGISAWRDRDVNLEMVDGQTGMAERVSAALITANMFSVLGIPPVAGRDFHVGEDRVDATPVAMLSYRFWQQHFGGSAAAIGKRIVTDGVSREIVGVMPRTFVFPRSTPELWFPIPLDPSRAIVGNFNLRGIARLSPGATTERARADLERVLPGILDEFPSGIPPAMWEQAHMRPVVTPLLDSIVGDVSQLLWVLFGSVGLVLLIACANVANLLLVRGEARQLELAVRGALGSGVAGIVAQCLSESFVLAAAGGAIGILLTLTGVAWATGLADTISVPRLRDVSVDGSVLAFAVAICVLSALLVSLIPLLRARRIPIAIVLRESGRGATSGIDRQRTRSILVVSQVALALVLVAGSGLLGRSFARLRNVAPGFDARHVAVTRMALSAATYPTGTSVVRFYARLLDEVRALPGVQNATISDWVPLSGDHNDNIVTIEDHPLPPDLLPRVHFAATVDPAYFRTMGIPLLAGRAFQSPYGTHRSAEMIVSKAFAERYWPGGNPLGKNIRPGIAGPWYTIVGEVANVHYEALDKPAEDAIYGSLSSADSSPTSAPRFVSLLIKTRGEQDLSLAVRNIVHALDPALPTYDQQSLDAVVAAASARARATVLLLVVASSLALILGAVGLYGVMAYGVSLRQREIGVRIALGAQPAEVSRMISRQGLGLALLGIGVGAAIALGATRLLSGLLYDVSPTDPLTFGATCIGLLGIAGLASWIPGRRAAMVDPSEVLKSA